MRLFGHRAENSLGGLQSAQCCHQKVRVLGEHSLVAHGVAKALDLVCNVCLHLVEGLYRVRHRASTLVHVLDGAGVAVVVYLSPGALVCLEDLIRCVSKCHFL